MELKDLTDLFFEDIAAGLELPRLKKGPMRTAHIMRWSAACENWHRIHYDHPFATGHDGLPGLMVNGSWKQNVIVQLLADWVGESGWVWKTRFEFRAMNVPGETLYAWGTVSGTSDAGRYGLVDVEIGLVNDTGVESTPGTAVVVMRKRDGPAVPYPFDPAILSPAA